MDNGVVYGFVGPMGGGKTYRLNEIKKKSQQDGRIFIEGDFSDGIRESIERIFGSQGIKLSPEMNSYTEWKQREFTIQFPCACCGRMRDVTLNGRDLLKNVGEYMKEIKGEDIWAQWTLDNVKKKFMNIFSYEDQRCANIAFGSIRFESEARAVFEFSKIFEQEVKIIFCNYNNSKLQIKCHESEKLANMLIASGSKDGDCVTDIIQRMYNIK